MTSKVTGTIDSGCSAWADRELILDEGNSVTVTASDGDGDSGPHVMIQYWLSTDSSIGLHVDADQIGALIEALRKAAIEVYVP